LEIVLVRHAQPDWEPNDRAVDDPGLTPLGQQQAESVAKHLAGEDFDAIYLSPLRRVVETAAPFLEARAEKGEHCHWLRETGLPSLQGQTRSQVEKYFKKARSREFGDWWDGLPEGERFQHFYERVSGGIESLLADGHATGVHEEAGQRLWDIEKPGRRLLIFAHEGTNAVLISHLLGVEAVPWANLRFATSWAGISLLRTLPIGSRWVWSLHSFNRIDHLGALKATRPHSGDAGDY